MKTRSGERGGSKEQGPLGRWVADRIKDDIFRRRLLPREPLVEAELAGAYGVSKTPVREALSSLARGGLVEIDPFCGARVRDFTAEDVREIYEIRALLEPFALQKAVPRMDGNDLDLLFSLLEDADAAAEREDPYVLSELNQTFHDALIARCNNQRIIETMDQIQDQLRSIALRSWTAKPTYLLEAEQHREVAKAVESRDARRAADLLRTHIAQFEEQFVRALEYEPTGSKTGLKRR
jgi:DNA-binding GntR family transcriptional regulator